MDLPVAAPDARCAAHPDRSASFVCGRCGAFGCEECQAPQGPLCQACESRQAAALAAPLTVSETLANAYRLPWEMRRHAAIYLAVSLTPHIVWSVISYFAFPSPRDEEVKGIVSWLGGATHGARELLHQLRPFLPHFAGGTAATLTAWTAWLFATGAMTVVIVGKVQGRPITMGAAYSATLRRLLTLIVCNTLALIGGLIGLALCILPGMAFIFFCGLIDPLVILGGKGPFSAIGASARLTTRAPVPMLVLWLITVVTTAVVGWPINLAEEAAGKLPGLSNLLSVVDQLVGYLVTLPIICGIAYAYVRLEARGNLREESNASDQGTR